MAGTRYFGFNTTEAITLRNLFRAPPTFTQRGGVLRQTAQANSAAPDVATLVTNFNTLLGKLRTSGLLAP